MEGLPEVFLLAPMLLAAVAGISALFADMLLGRRAAAYAALAGLVTSGATGVVLAGLDGTVMEMFIGAGAASAVSVAIAVVAAVALVGGWRSITSAEHGGQVVALIAFSAAACMALVSSIDLAALLVSLEAVALASYALVSSARSEASDEAALKYLVQGAVITATLVYGIAVLVGVSGGHTRFAELAGLAFGAGNALPLATGIVLVMAAVLFKLSAFPFHSWAPDAYQASTAPVAAFIATAPKIAVLGTGAVLLGTVFSAQASTWSPMLAVVAALSVAFGNLVGLRQRSYQRLLAYSGIAQMGYAVSGLAAVSLATYPLMIFSGTYALSAAGAFLAAEAVRESRPSWDGTVEGLTGLGRRRPILAAALAVLLLSLTGIPLTAGFWGKLLVFGTVVESGKVWLAVVGVLGSVVSFGYYGGVLKAMYLGGEGDAVAEDEASAARPGPASWVVGLLAAVVLVAGIVPLFGGLDVIGRVLQLP